MDSGAVNVKHDPKVNGYASQDRKAVDEGPVGRFQRDLSNRETFRKKSSVWPIRANNGSHHQTAATSHTVKHHNPYVCATDLQVDGKYEGRGSDDGQGLVVRGGFSILAHGLQEGSIRDEEDDEGDKDAVEQTDEEVLEVKQRPLLSRQVELWEFQAKFVIHILEEEKDDDDDEEWLSDNGANRVCSCYLVQKSN